MALTMGDEVVPTRAEVAEVIDHLLTGSITRDEASRWGASRSAETGDDVIDEAVIALWTINYLQEDEFGRCLGYMWDFSELELLRSRLT